MNVEITLAGWSGARRTDMVDVAWGFAQCHHDIAPKEWNPSTLT
jgi:hypothetical protein